MLIRLPTLFCSYDFKSVKVGTFKINALQLENSQYFVYNKIQYCVYICQLKSSKTSARKSYWEIKNIHCNDKYSTIKLY